jgi:general secretion pathway protein E
LKAMELRASDIHIEPFEGKTIIRLRVDGVLHELRPITPQQHQEVAARLKVMSKLDLAESRRPQDGRLQVRSGGRNVDVRLSSVPTIYGERIVMRLLEKGARALNMDELGLLPHMQATLRDCLAHSYGFVLVTGPTGSGKTTTLYTVLQEVSTADRNVLTIEDPVEYRCAGVGQIQVNEKIGLTFAVGLRSILRQDPDTVMVGEIRDPETANIAVNAALTGHMVLSTLHATRLIDLKVPPFLLSSCLLGVMAQRLVRRLCDQCKQPHQPTAEDFRRLGLENVPTKHQICKPVGCPACMETGYRGRMGIHELLKVAGDISSRIAREADARELRALAREKGMKSLMEDAAEKVLLGWTSLDEAVRTARAQ